VSNSNHALLSPCRSFTY